MLQHIFTILIFGGDWHINYWTEEMRIHANPTGSWGNYLGNSTQTSQLSESIHLSVYMYQCSVIIILCWQNGLCFLMLYIQTFFNHYVIIKAANIWCLFCIPLCWGITPVHSYPCLVGDAPTVLLMKTRIWKYNTKLWEKNVNRERLPFKKAAEY